MRKLFAFFIFIITLIGLGMWLAPKVYRTYYLADQSVKQVGHAAHSVNHAADKAKDQLDSVEKKLQDPKLPADQRQQLEAKKDELTKFLRRTVKDPKSLLG